MREDYLKQLRREQYVLESMAAHTIRIPRELSEEIRDFCGQTGIRVATVWRKCLIIGWREINRDLDEQDS
jgi:hypothetical protein